LINTLAAHFLKHEADYWVRLIHAVKVPVGLVNNIAEALADPQVAHRDMLVEIPHRLNTSFKMIGSPMKLSETPVQYHRAPPLLGQDTQTILAQFCDQTEIEQLQSDGVIGIGKN
jgi:crotonobetainyl-CoA:carnitine CoA-transferase CaiB-like acyl-CoA transferase